MAIDLTPYERVKAERDTARIALAKSEAECERLRGLKVGEVMADAGRSLDLPDGETWDRTRAVLGRLVNATLALLECLSGKDAASVILRPQTEAVRAVLADPDGQAALALWRALEAVFQHQEDAGVTCCGEGTRLHEAVERARRGKGE